ncbi:unnamed protein product [Ceutorhynchus assimilis]|uniref:Uncharacterized protein n=1 Tax=Ceutorhynchus assimilis TaxID=467358 RepID=A0A9N9MZ24_9CUCU|nr:unnamed protein product [Ceutorhynchus assimilis]
MADLEPNRIKKSTLQLQQFINGIEKNLNPFTTDLESELLYNISSGEAVAESIRDCLLNVESIGSTLRQSFIAECAVDKSRFELAIKRNKMYTFTDSMKKKKVTVAGKVQEVRKQRDLFGRLLGLSFEQQINIEKVFTYPLTPVPLSLCHIDGNICKTNKSILMKCLEQKIESEKPERIDAVIIDGSIKVWLEVGVGNAQRYINVTKMYESLGKTLSSSLPGFHALTGCYFNPAFFRKGKKRPLSILKGCEDYQKSIINLAKLEQSDTQQVFEILEVFICHMYSMKKVRNVNEARVAMFTRMYADNISGNFFKPMVKNFDGSAVPPCQSELHQQILRASYISTIWRNAHSKYPTILSPNDSGWEEVDGLYEFRWFEGDQLPTFVNEVVIQSDEGEDYSNPDSDAVEFENGIDEIDDRYDKDEADDEYYDDNIRLELALATVFKENKTIYIAV